MPITLSFEHKVKYRSEYPWYDPQSYGPDMSCMNVVKSFQLVIRGNDVANWRARDCVGGRYRWDFRYAALLHG
jgi:hypothetical protein